MTAAPMTFAFAQPLNAAGIGSSAWLGRVQLRDGGGLARPLHGGGKAAAVPMNITQFPTPVPAVQHAVS